MPANYTLLKKDEQMIMKQFDDKFLDIIKFFEKQILWLEKGNEYDEAFDYALKRDKENMNDIRDIMDTCIWLIQKHEPRAGYLRLLIAIITSLSDLKRMSSYTATFSKLFYKYQDKLEPEIIKTIVHNAKSIVKYNLELFQIFKNRKDVQIMVKKSNELFDRFLKEFKKNYVSVINVSASNVQSDALANLIIIFKNFDRSMDHCMNIVENFSNIK